MPEDDARSGLSATARMALPMRLRVTKAAIEAIASADKPELYLLSKVKRGQKGYGMTTFQGTTPERFEFEVDTTRANERWRAEVAEFRARAMSPALSAAERNKAVTALGFIPTDRLSGRSIAELLP
mgnify:CR=1 FL=1